MIKSNMKLKELLHWGLFNSKINMCMKDNGKMIKEMEEVFNNGKMVQFIKVIGRIILLMVMVDLFMQMVMFMWVDGSMIEHQAKVAIIFI